ncbi:uncharacterized protein LOC134344314 isoform X5 [Mobula hypostoma]|uniref:uncharacterized protein LOC134344314 isoform X5 n=1 Tax=Mobula hypostoma TaxID=723540 RepID=UPI002FC37CB5
MSDADEIVHALKDTFKSETSEDPANDEKEIANKDSCGLQHQDNSKEVPDETPEIQCQNEFINRQDKVEAVSGQDRTQTSGQHEVESDTDKAQTEANNGISDKAMDGIDHLHIQETTDVDETQPPSNSGVKDVSQSEMMRIQIQASDDVQAEVWSEMQQVQEQIDRNEQGEALRALSMSNNFECQLIIGECTEVLGKSGQVESQLVSGQKDEVLFELDQVEDKSDNYEQTKSYSDLEKTEEQSTRRQNKTPCDVDQAENHPINGHSEAQTEQSLVQDQGDLGGQGGDSCESGQVNDDERGDTKSATSSDQPKALDGRKLKDATYTIKSLSAGRRTCLFTGKRFPTYSRKMGKFKMQRSSKGIENVNLIVLGAEKIESEPDEKNRSSVESILTNGTQNSAVGMMNVDDRQNTDTILAKKNVTQCRKGGKGVTKFWCDICKLVCTSALHLQIHFLGFKHKKIEKKRKEKQQWEERMAWMYRYPNLRKIKPTNTLKSKVAEIERIDGRGRVKVIRDYDKSPRSEKTTARKDAATADDLRCSIGSKILEGHIKKSNIMKAIIGLDFLTEYHYEEKSKPIYYCELCHYELDLKPMLAHISGLKHKKMYIRRHPDLCKRSPISDKLIVKKQAAEIERTHGRGRVKVIRDYDTCPPSKRTAEAKDESQLQDMEYCSFDQDQRTCMGTSSSSSHTDRKLYASPSSKPRSRVTCSKKSKLQDMEYCSFDQDQRICVETSYSSRCTDRKLYASPSSKPRSRVTSSKAESWTVTKYSRSESSTRKHNQTRKRESSKEIRHPGEDWRDECKRSIKRSKLMEDKVEKEESKHFDRDVDQRQESIWNSRDDHKQRDKSRNYRDDDHKRYDTSYWATEKYVPSRPEDITKEDVLGFLANFKVINDTDATHVKTIMYKLSNQLLQFGKRALQLTHSTEKLIETENPILVDEHCRYETHRAGILRNSPGHPAVQNATTSMSSIQNHLLTPSLLNSIRGMDVNTVTNTLARLAVNNPAFEGIRISTLVTVLMEAGVLDKRPN